MGRLPPKPTELLHACEDQQLSVILAITAFHRSGAGPKILTGLFNAWICWAISSRALKTGESVVARAVIKAKCEPGGQSNSARSAILQLQSGHSLA